MTRYAGYFSRAEIERVSLSLSSIDFAYRLPTYSTIVVVCEQDGGAKGASIPRNSDSIYLAPHLYVFNEQ